MAPLSAEDQLALQLLIDAQQEHLLEGVSDEERQGLLEHVRQLDAGYSDGGLLGYVQNARTLLEASARGENPLAGFTPSVPEGKRLTYGDEDFCQYEEIGIQEARASVFVLVAGGLGERLGFSGIKLALPTSTLTFWTYLELYARSLLMMQSTVGPGEPIVPIPLVLMTSDDTHERTLAVLNENNFFGLSPEQVHVMKQEKVACLADGSARISRDPKNPGRIETKPHGHGDIHALFYSTGLAKRFQEEGRRWLVFFQDTNAFFFRVLPAALGVSASCGMAMNSCTVPRKPKDAMGGIVRLTRQDGTGMTLNVEYNQLDPLLRATVMPEGDAPDETGNSPFPGNQNSLIIAMDAYMPTLERTRGVIAEFVNPKYKDSTKTAFKSSTRLECMMQDFPKELPPTDLVGFTQFDLWCSYSPVKNDPNTALDKVRSGNHPQCATTGETDLFASNCRILRMFGAEIEEPQQAVFNGIPVDLEARVIWSPQWAHSHRAVGLRLAPGARLCISQRSTLILDGDVTIEGELVLDGALILAALPGATARVQHLHVVNEGWQLQPAQPEDDDDEITRMRGFSVVRVGQTELFFEQPGEYAVDDREGATGYSGAGMAEYDGVPLAPSQPAPGAQLTLDQIFPLGAPEGFDTAAYGLAPQLASSASAESIDALCADGDVGGSSKKSKKSKKSKVAKVTERKRNCCC